MVFVEKRCKDKYVGIYLNNYKYYNSIERTEIFDNVKIEDETTYIKERLMKMLAVKVNKESFINISFENIEKFQINHSIIERKEDFIGTMGITFNYLIKGINYSASIEIYQSTGHADLKLISTNSKVDNKNYTTSM